MPNIFETIKDKNIVHCVIAEQQSIILQAPKKERRNYSKVVLSDDFTSTNYFLLIAEKDEVLFSNIGFDTVRPSSILTRARDLSTTELDHFKKHIENYVIVQQDENGRVYEQKNNSFKDYYSTHKLEMLSFNKSISELNKFIKETNLSKSNKKKLEDKIHILRKTREGAIDVINFAKKLLQDINNK